VKLPTFVAPSLLFVLCASAISAPSPTTSGCVSYQFNSIRDRGRSYSSGAELQAYRPVEYGLWAPAAQCAHPRMTYADYARDASVQRGLAQSEVDARGPGWAELFGMDDPPDANVLATPTRASRQAPTLSAGGDLVVYVHASVLEAHALAEALAASGTPVMALTWRGTYLQEFDVGASGLVTEMLDLQVALRDLGARGASVRRIVVVGTSFGALTALCWHGAEPRVQAIVSLDGGVATPTAAKLLPACPYVKAPTTVAVLHLYDASYADVTFDYLRSRSDVTLTAVPIPLLQHNDYHSTVFVRAAGQHGTDAVERQNVAHTLVDRVRDFANCAFKDQVQVCLDRQAHPPAPPDAS
jgi:dienelactone hydrolase